MAFLGNLLGRATRGEGSVLQDHYIIASDDDKDARDVLQLYPDRIVEAIRSGGPEMMRMLMYINKCLEGKEGKTMQGKDLSKERHLTKELVNEGVILCIVEVLKCLGARHESAGVVSEASWALDNILEYGEPSFFAKAIDAGVMDALVHMLGNETMAPSAVSVLRKLIDEYLPSHSLLANHESNAKGALQKLSFANKCPTSYVWEASSKILTTMDWSSDPSPTYLIRGGSIIEEAILL